MNRYLPIALGLVLVGTILEAQPITWISPCSDKVFCLNQGACDVGEVFLVEQAHTTCGNGLLNYSFRIDLFNDGTTEIISSQDTVSGEFPLGTHKVTWRVTDNCGKANTCTYLFTVRDCLPPNLVCINGLTQNLDPPFCQETFMANQFILMMQDDCTALEDIDVGMRVTGTGMGFPEGVTSLTFDHCDQGINFIEIWVRDSAGLTNSCQGYVLVQNGTNGCICNEDADIDFRGCVRTAGGLRMNQYTVRAEVTETVNPDSVRTWSRQINTQDSCYSLELGGLPFGGNYDAELRAFRKGGYLVGFTTFDLVMISKHILGIESFTNFYQMLAADLNNSQTVTTFDILEGRKLLLGIYDTFPAVPSWRLIRPLDNPSELLQWSAVVDTYQVSYTNLLQDTFVSGLDFIGVKMGDINLSAQLLDPDDRSGSPVVLRYLDRSFSTGERLAIPVRYEQATAAEGFQLTLRVDPACLYVTGISGIPADCFHFDPESGQVKIIWLAGDGNPDDGLAFTLHAEAIAAGKVSAAVSVAGDGPLRAEIYLEGDARIHPLLVLPAYDQASSVVFFAPYPNPATAATRFPFWLREAGEVHLEVYDGQGRLAALRSEWHPAGRGEIMWPPDLPVSGLYGYRISAMAEQKVGVVIGGKP